MKVRELLEGWQEASAGRRVTKELCAPLPLHDLARLMALAELYPGRDQTQLLADLLSAALDEVAAAFPYVQGEKVVAEDDYGDPLYEDVGLTPRFLALTQKYLRVLEAAAEGN